MTSPRALCLAAQARFEAAGIADGDRDAQLLMRHALSQLEGHPVPRHQLTDLLNAPAPTGLEALFAPMVDARAARQPVSQIIGRRAFWTHEFEVTPDTLDPRPDTEALVEAALKHPFRRVLDLGTGTGAILISLLAERPGATGLGTDLSEAALAVARRNAAAIGVEAQFLLSDWLAEVQGRFDLIVSNPPYIALAEMAGLSPEVREWEPRMALTDEGDGLAAYRAIVSAAPRHLEPGGWLMVEIGPTQAADVMALMRDAGLENVGITPDLDGRDRVISAQFPA
ncbi:peptide chain release factor N(5)-glutamine methyltransferase [Paracoccus sulfuroxidans]|uniref:Release factor glutamine methyltransferase n=1 Tax=Paracoccus sulfuroxidans TaxID=384678 RepID=A0A562NXP0_9RHOB|nr:peptide chain release factor N(5)-glutamine methyltransferase [Paracoccus sulfuroxidans]TWI36964.1 [protein release factor]-glutamine N5-methyltransferase [Paracoccus sulfuroxidans]